MMVSTFSILNKNNRERVFEKSFLLAEFKLDIILKIPFLTISNANIDFQVQNLQQKSYTTRNVLSTTRLIELIEKKKFVITALNPKHEAFVIYITAFKVDLDDKMHPLKRAQIAYLKANKAFIEIPSKYTDFVDIFLSKLATKLPKYMEINDHFIKFVKGLATSIWSYLQLGVSRIRNIKGLYQKHLDNGFIWPSKSVARVPISFEKKPDGSLRLSVNYRDL